MSYSCPLDFTRIDSNASRLSAFIVAFLVVIYLFTSNLFILYFLFIDFATRLFIDKKYSFVWRLSLSLRKLLRIKESFIDGGAKRLAGMFGLFFVGALLLSHFFANGTISLLVAGIFLACSLLDVFINYCLGCQIYYIIKKTYPSFMN